MPERCDPEARRTSERLRSLIEAAPLAITELDLDGTVRFWNSAAEQLFGWTSAEATGRRWPVVPEEKRHESEQLFARIRQGESIANVETTRVRRDGTPIDVSLSAAPLRDDDGSVVGIMNVVIDITERKQLEAQLRQAQRMEAVGRLAGGIAHDFNNLLTAINGYASLLYDNLADGDPRADDAAQIVQAGERAARLTRQLLAFSRQQVLHPRLLDLNAVVSELGEMLERLIGEDVELRLRLDPQLGSVCADLGQLEQVIVNLVVNARDAMPAGGVLTIASRTVEVTSAQRCDGALVPAGRYVRLEVADTGAGIDPALLSRIFEPFFTTKEAGKGTGLGLATVYGIVKQSGGFVWVFSEPGEGTRFEIDLPEVAAPE